MTPMNNEKREILFCDSKKRHTNATNA